MEIVDNAFIVTIPGALAASLTDGLVWWSLLSSLAIAFVVTVPVKGRSRHAAVVVTYVVGVAEFVNVTLAEPTLNVFPAWIALVSVVLLVCRPQLPREGPPPSS